MAGTIAPMWRYRGQERPAFAHVPGPGQESVWDYPRPPAVRATDREVEVRSGARTIAHTRGALRVLESASPPTFYLPASDVDFSVLEQATGGSVCEWKGMARYWQLTGRDDGEVVAWDYPQPAPPFEALRERIAFYPGRVACFVDGERVRAQPGRFYGGWVTDELVGPFKGEPGSGHW